MKIAAISFTLSGCEYSRRIQRELTLQGEEVHIYTKSLYTAEEGIDCVSGSLSAWTKEMFATQDAILFIGASGIAVRSIAPYVKDKKKDPAVVVMDEQGRFVISLLSGHLGGANELAERIAAITGSLPVITTATDINGKFAVDVFAKKNGLVISRMDYAKEISAALVAGEKVGLYCEGTIEGTVPEELQLWQEGEEQPSVGMVISPFCEKQPYRHTLYLVPRVVTLGLGCRKHTPEGRIADRVSLLCGQMYLSEMAIQQVASIDVKKEEEGILSFCEKRKLPFVTYPAEELLAVPGDFQESEFVKKQVGVGNVCERSALCACPEGKLIHGKFAAEGVTAALVMKDWRVKF